MEFTLLIDGRVYYTGSFQECLIRAYYTHNTGSIVRSDTYELITFFRYVTYPDGYRCIVISPIERPCDSE